MRGLALAQGGQAGAVSGGRGGGWARAVLVGEKSLDVQEVF